MLQSLRKGASSWVARIFLGLLSVTFGVGIWQGNTLFTSHSSEVLVTIGQTQIKKRAFLNDFNREVQRYQQQFGPSFTRQQAVAFGLPSRVLSKLVSEATFTEAARDLGLRAPDGLVAMEISKIRAFHDASGQYSASQARAVLRQSGLTETGFEDEIRRQMIQDQLLSPISQDVEVPKIEAELIYKFHDEKRTFAWFELPPAAAGILPTPDDAALKTYLDAHKSQYSTPELRAITLLVADPATLAKDIHPTDKAVKDAYDEHKGDFMVEERRSYLLMVLKTKADADQAIAKIKGGADFLAVAKEMAGLDPADVKQAFTVKATLPQALGNAVFSLPEMGISAPVQTALGWQVAKVTGIEPSRVKSLDEVKNKIAHELALETAQNKITDLTSTIQDTLAGGATLEEAGKTLNLTLRKIPAIDRQGRDAEGKVVADLPRAADVLGQLFSIQSGHDGGLTDTEDGGAYVARVDSVTPTAVKPFDKIKGQLVKAWTAAERTKTLDKLAKTLAERVSKGESLDSVAASVSAKVETLAPVKRAGDPASAGTLSNALLSSLFAAKINAAVAGDKPKGGAAIVVQVKAIIPADPAKDEKGLKALTVKVKSSLANDIAGALESDYKKRFGIEFNKNAINQLAGTLQGLSQ